MAATPIRGSVSFLRESERPKITPAVLRQFNRYLQDERGFCLCSISRTLPNLKSFLTWAAAAGILEPAACSGRPENQARGPLAGPERCSGRCEGAQKEALREGSRDKGFTEYVHDRTAITTRSQPRALTNARGA